MIAGFIESVLALRTLTETRYFTEPPMKPGLF